MEGKGGHLSPHYIRSSFRTGILEPLVCPHGGIPSDVAEASATIVVFCVLKVLPGLLAIIVQFFILVTWAVVNEQRFFGVSQTFVVEGSSCESSFVELLELLCAAAI